MVPCLDDRARQRCNEDDRRQKLKRSRKEVNKGDAATRLIFPRKPPLRVATLLGCWGINEGHPNENVYSSVKLSHPTFLRHLTVS
jgi:hypothetical protein